ncbi:MAG: hypothetical protein IPH31_04795 [Lewinellaceae bacterium]|nr:hypothetical protein [Lewinellaceae bacterium]
MHIIRLPNGAELKIEDWFAAMELPESSKLSGSFCPPAAHQFNNDPNSDLFAIAFVMLTRWEETQNVERDAHGRFPQYNPWLGNRVSPPPGCERMGRLALGKPWSGLVGVASANSVRSKFQ